MFSTIKNDKNLRLSDREKLDILTKKMPAPDEKSGLIYADAVFQGAGIKTIALLGALRCCDDLGIRWRKLAGTSAGAITAAFVAANISIDELEKIWGEYNYMNFLSEKTHPLIFTGDPADDLMFPWPMLFSLLITGKLGLYSSDPFCHWIERILQTANLSKFGDLKKQEPSHELKVVISDISRGEMLILPDDLINKSNQSDRTLMQKLGIDHPEDFSIAEAVRLSMSIPLFFEPGKLGKYAIVDGGISSNFPLWIYDVPTLQQPQWPTFGFQILDKRSKEFKINSSLQLLRGTIFTAMSSRDRYQLREIDQGRVIDIDVTSAEVSSIDFKIGTEKRQLLYRMGYEQTKQFFLNDWSWNQHLALRGFPVDQVKLA